MMKIQNIKNLHQEDNYGKLINFSILNIDKPSGPTSFTITDYIRKSLKLNKTSHMGTLDPAVSGVLPITLGRACRLSNYFMHSDKEYVGIMRLHKKVSEEKLKEVIKEFIGKITQLPPIRSSVKRAERIREVKSFEIFEIQGKDILFKTNVQAGTYIRKLCSDMGEKIGGAHMLELRRTRASIFSENDKNFINLYKFDELLKDPKKLVKYLIPAEEAIKKVLPQVQLSDKNLNKIFTGKPLMKNDFIGDLNNLKEEFFAAFIKDRFIGVYKKVKEGDILAKAEFVYN